MDVRRPLGLIVNESELMEQLLSDTTSLIRCTEVISAIKRLVTAYEILNMNLEIDRKFSKSVEYTWDLGSFKDLKLIRSELIVYNSRDFNPDFRLKKYGKDINKLLNTVSHRLQVNL